MQDVSHELKTPIFSAQGFIHTLIDGAIEDERVRSKFLRKAAKSLDYLDLLVRDLLTISQMESGEIRMKKETFCINELINETIEQLEPRASKNKISLINKNLNGSGKILVVADYYRIYQVLKNLVTNAIKYSDPDTSVTVYIKKRKKVATIHVEDQGKGLAKNLRKRVFERFYRIDKGRSTEKGGTGLGLSIVNKIINDHNGEINFVSIPNGAKIEIIFN